MQFCEMQVGNVEVIESRHLAVKNRRDLACFINPKHAVLMWQMAG